MKRFEPQPRAVMPDDFEAWYAEIMLLADTEGEAATVGQVMRYAPIECVRYLGAQQALWADLITRARYADELRWCQGVRAGRRMRA